MKTNSESWKPNVLPNIGKTQNLSENIYILCVFTEKPYSKPLERNVVYTPIIIFIEPRDVAWL